MKRLTSSGVLDPDNFKDRLCPSSPYSLEVFVIPQIMYATVEGRTWSAVKFPLVHTLGGKITQHNSTLR